MIYFLIPAALGVVGAYKYLKETGDHVGWIIAAVVASQVALIAAAPERKGTGTDCYVDWDGRSNSYVCD